MGLSSNQARFLSLTSRQIDLESRIQQICQRRLRLSSEIENVATSYNNQISNRKMFIPSTGALQSLSIDSLQSAGFSVIRTEGKTLLKPFTKDATPISVAKASQAYDSAHMITNAAEFLSKITGHESENFILTNDIDMSALNLTNSAITTVFTGSLDGNGHTINNLTINTLGVAMDNIGLFSEINGGTVKNLGLENVNINASNSQAVGGIVGMNSGGTVDNSYSTGSITGLGGTGGLVGRTVTGATVTNSYADVTVSGSWGVGGLVGANWDSAVSNSYALGNVVNTTSDSGGLIGNNYNSTVTNCYSTGSVDSTGYSGGLVGYNKSSAITYSYATGNVNSGSQTNGLVGGNSSGGTDDATNFYKNNMSADAAGGAAVNASVSTPPTATWDTDVWDLSGSIPKIKDSKPTNEQIEEGLRNGELSLVRDADEFTQTPLSLSGKEYEEVDWRTIPAIYDELYKSDDVDAENKYDKIVREINAQDKKLQLEQTSIETEYRAISSEKDAVKKILDTNAQSSFKYFS